MNYPKLLPLALCTTLAATASAAWQLVDDFSTDTVASGAWTYDINPVENTSPSIAVEDGKLAIHPGVADENTLNLGAYRQIPDIDIFGAGTVFLQVQQPIVNGTKGQIDTVWGVSDLQVNQDRYNDFMALMRIEYDESFDVYDGTTIGSNRVGYQTVLANGVGVTGGVWYNVWIVLNAAENGYKVYVQGGPEYPEQTLVYPDPALPNNDPDSDGYAGFRKVGGFDNINNFRILSSAGRTTDVIKGIDPTYFDNLYVDTSGENLANPLGGTAMGPGIFGGFALEDGSVHTGQWMGPLWVEDYPWVYSYNLSKWLYVPDADGSLEADAGVWLWAGRPAAE
ncbi:MAG: hypothetical protein Q7P63_00225 [Verrucomicrobiota bacterium JB022]|nr:hypothetical protein [Verrucomicrobiota bacterium JB022]